MSLISSSPLSGSTKERSRSSTLISLGAGPTCTSEVATPSCWPPIAAAVSVNVTVVLSERSGSVMVLLPFPLLVSALRLID